MLTFANVWNLLSPMRSVASGYELQLVGDVTHKASLAAVNKLGFGVNMLGGKAAPWTFSLIPHQSESDISGCRLRFCMFISVYIIEQI